MSKLKTCATCKVAKINRFFNSAIPYCGDTTSVIPHNSNLEGKKLTLTYWRIPMDCPRLEIYVEKRTKIVAKKDMETVVIDLSVN